MISYFLQFDEGKNFHEGHHGNHADQQVDLLPVPERIQDKV